ncbi:coiled-coil domain-containing protein 40 isoform X2 [Sceloporus undulatus]|uniref:coiled-coil domain-containing protein 40 isoform X2 n=1 Tax=Sceloporus undulatus TaxID=8520 RepID=UPI001C4DC443|nr:coiled-coil domain-containing protein 40 isoform X2 [Sceloporus undulatus]
MEPSSRDEEPDHGEIAEDEKKELLTEDEGLKDTSPNQGDEVATAPPAEPEDSIAKEEDAGNAPTEEREGSTPMEAREDGTGLVPSATTEEEAAEAPAAPMEEEAVLPAAPMEEEVVAPAAPMEEAVALAAPMEEEAVAPAAPTEEAVAPAAPMEEAVAPAAPVAEEAVAPAAPMEEGAGVDLVTATEEGAAIVPEMALEEGAGVTPAAAMEEVIEVAAAAAMEERVAVAPAAAMGERLLGKTLSLPGRDIYDYRGSSFQQDQLSEIFANIDNIPSALYSETLLSPVSSAASSLRSEIPELEEQHVASGAAGSVAFSPYTESSLQPFSLQFGSLGRMEDHGDEDTLRFTEGNEAEEETQLVVLDPEHPLMKRFQSALKGYLHKQIGKLTDELRELTVATNHGKVQREELGVILYGVQQQLVRLQMELEKNHNSHSQIAMARRQLEEELNDLRKTYKKTYESTGDERKAVSSRQMEIEKLSLRLFYMKNMDQDVRDDIAVMKRTVKKAEMERMRAEVEKQKQDLHVDQLTKRVNDLQEQIALYEAQHMAQAEDTKITRKEVAEAITEIQAIHLEKKRLLHDWANSLTGMKRRDEAYAAMQEALRESRHKLKSLEVEIEVYKKSIIKEEERNELLASILNRSENDGNTSRKLISQSLAKQDAMKVEFGTYTRTLHETEQALNRANMDQASRMNELAILRRDTEKGSQTKQELESEIMVKLQDRLMSNKAAKYYLQLGVKLQNQLMNLEIQLTKIENETAQTMLNITNTNCKLNMLEKNLSDVDKEMDNLNKQISHSEAEISKRNLLIRRKQGMINMYNKKLEMMISQLGGQELGPLEIEIKKLTKHIDETELEVVKLQRHWLKQQKELVKLSQERDEQLASLDMVKKEITIKEQKKVRIENEIQQEKNELKDIEHHMKNMANDLVKLHLLINKNRENSEDLQQGNTIMENEFVRSLKASEKESIQMQEKLNQIHEEKERLLNSLVEAECQMMQWEKKIQLAKEMRAAVDSETGQGEIRAMKSEIHRMQNAEECNGIIAQLENSQRNVTNALLEKQKELSLLNSEVDDLEIQADLLQAKKRQNLSDIVSSQVRMKYLQAVKEGKYNPLCRSEIMIRVERQKLEERLHAISVILHQVEQDYPHYQRTLQKLDRILKNKLDEQETM